MPARPSTRTARRTLGLAGVALALVLVAGCYHNPDPTSWDDAKAKSNFILGCTRSVTAGNGTTTSVAIASKDTCTCIYNKIKAPEDAPKGKYPIKWEDLKSYEAKQADAKAADAPPDPPKNLTKAIAECKAAGPAA